MDKINFNSEPGKYTYTNSTAHSKSVYGVVPDGSYRAGSRNSYAMKQAKEACFSDYQKGDERGHMLLHGKGGADDIRNISAQHKDVNHGSQTASETEIRNTSQSPENTVFVRVVNSASNSTRPDSTMITMASKDSHSNIDVKHTGFQNASYADQQSWNDTVQSLANDIEPSQDAGLSAEERSLADSLCGEEVSVNMSLGDCSYLCNDTSAVFDDNSLAIQCSNPAQDAELSAEERGLADSLCGEEGTIDMSSGDCSYLCNDTSSTGSTDSSGSLDSGGADSGGADSGGAGIGT